MLINLIQYANNQSLNHSYLNTKIKLPTIIYLIVSEHYIILLHLQVYKIVCYKANPIWSNVTDYNLLFRKITTLD